ncbi:hypothetical protein K7X08_036068 [Anisodus acutangulus]|uniref:Myb/SANT-like domain-containing protein n=1 Tax=Anisodus acutangulus TaxID=402998 RepID=A0A9Q1L864_9SOLA|nr:hypothetical protein K7X08_036068 [Anisodus acutangulus]
MGDSQQGNNKAKGKEKENYESWTIDDTNELLYLLVDAINSGLRYANGSLSKQNVERVILPRINAKFRFPKTYNHYLSQMKWLKTQYNKMYTLMRNNSGFGWDPIAKTFTASDEVWKDYLKFHPSHKKLREKSVVDYEDLKIVFGGVTVNGNGSIALGTDDTDATTYEEENRAFGMEDFSYDPNNDAFIAPNHYEPAYQPLSPHQCSPPSHYPLGSKVPTEKSSGNKRSRSEYEGSSSSVGTINQAKVLENLSIGIETISVNFEKISNLMEKRERERDREKNIWDAIKEISSLFLCCKLDNG